MKLNPLTSEPPHHGVPRHNIILTSFFQHFQAYISVFKNLQAGISALGEFVTVGKAIFVGLMG